MQKKLMAIAVAGVLAAPVAMAQSTVTLSGVLDVAIESQKVDNGAVPGVNGVTRNGLNTQTSYVRMTGKEDLGGGLNAFFQIEAGVNMENRPSAGSNGITTFGGRPTFVGLSGGFGSVLIGSNTNPMGDLATDVMDSGNGRTYAMANLFTLGQSTGQSGNPSTTMAATNCYTQTCIAASAVTFYRRSPVVQYASPNFGGVTLRASWEIPENQNTLGTAQVNVYKPQVLGFSAKYANGPIMAGAAYEEHQDLRANNDANKSGLKDKAWLFGGSYNFGFAKLFAGYSNLRYGDPATRFAGDGGNDNKTWGVGAIFPFGASSIGLGYAQAKVENDVASVAGAAAGTSVDNKVDQWTVVYQYAMSKRTNLYAAYSKINNGKTQARVFWVNGLSGSDATGNGTTVTSGQSPQVLGFGIQHFF